MAAFARPKRREPLDENALFEYAVGSLARRMRSVRDLRRLMRLRAEPGDRGEQAISAVVQRLTDLRYLSDERFAADYTRLRKEGQSLGRRRVQQDLAARGIAKDLAVQTLETAYAETDDLALARAFCERKRLRPPANEKETVRLVSRLGRAGFGSATVWALLREWRVALAEDQAGDDLIPEPEG